MAEFQNVMLSFYGLFAFIGLSSVIAISFISFSLIGWAFAKDEHGFIFLILIITGALLFFDPSMSGITFKDIFNLNNLFMLLAYIAIGVVWSFYKWFDFVKTQVINLNATIKRFLKKDESRISQLNKDYFDVCDFDANDSKEGDYVGDATQYIENLKKSKIANAMNFISRARYDDSANAASVFNFALTEPQLKSINPNSEGKIGDLRTTFDSNEFDKYIQKIDERRSINFLKNCNDVEVFKEFKFVSLEPVINEVRKNVVISAKNHIEKVSFWIFWWPLSVCSFLLYDFFMKIKEFIVNFFSGVYTKISNTLLNDSNL